MSPLARRLAAQIAQTGPITVAQFMAAALFDSRDGYYASRPALGAAGDFLTAPEISQMFGEIVGLWCVQSWLDMDRPAALQLIELGPGRGRLMADILRAARVAPEFLDAVQVTLVEVSPPLRDAQARALSGVAVTWVKRLEDAPVGASLVIGNEFLDCLPIRQFVRDGAGWRERLVGVDPHDPERLMFGLSAPAPEGVVVAAIPPPLVDAPAGAVAEVAPGLATVIDAVAARLQAAPGRALFLDYGAASAPGDTLQAVQRHAKVPVLDTAGEADLTAHVDFGTVRRLARASGLDVAGPVGQGAWLEALGIGLRAHALAKARPDQAETIQRAHARLTAEDQMGRLFKAIALSTPGLPAPAGFPW